MQNLNKITEHLWLQQYSKMEPMPLSFMLSCHINDLL